MSIESRFASIKNECDKISKDLLDPKVQADHKKLGELYKRENELKTTLEKIKRYEDLGREIKDTKEIMENESEGEMKTIALEELGNLEKEKESLGKDLEVALVPKDPSDERNVILEIRAGTGGDEAELFAAELFRMYQRYAEKKGWKASVSNSSRTGIGGIKEIICEIRGKEVYKNLKFEGGVHRVQRIPATEKSGRIHTSTATVAVLPEAKEVEVEIKPDEIKIDTFRSSGPGGQSVNTTDSAVRITHLSSGLVVSCQDEKSQLKNREKAMKILRSRLLLQKQEEERKKVGAERKGMVGTGDRSEKIRTYNYPQDRITDHRIKFTVHGMENVLNGNLEPIINKLQEEEARLKVSAEGGSASSGNNG